MYFPLSSLDNEEWKFCFVLEKGFHFDEGLRFLVKIRKNGIQNIFVMVYKWINLPQQFDVVITSNFRDIWRTKYKTSGKEF